MSSFSNLRTTDISTSTDWQVDGGNPAVVIDGDTIITDGYQTANDGGGATFTVRNREINETPDGIFTFAIAGSNNTGLIAVLTPLNGVVSMDQLGYFGLADDMDLEHVDTATGYDAFYSALLQDARYHAFPGVATHLQAAIDNTAVQEIRFTAGRMYPIAKEVFIDRSNITLNGNGALLYTNQPATLYPCIQVMPDGNGTLDNVCLRNLRFAKIVLSLGTPCIEADSTSHLRVENVTFIMSFRGLVVYNSTGVVLRHVRASNCCKVFSATATTDVEAEDITFTNPFRGGSNAYNNLSDAVFEFGAGCERAVLRDVQIVDTICRTAIAAVGTQASPVEDMLVDGLLAESVGNLLPNAAGSPNGNVFYFQHAQDVSVLHAQAAQIDCAVTMEDVHNVKIMDGKFESRLGSGSAIVQPTSGVCDDVWFLHCLFIANAWFYVQNRVVSGDDFKFAFCVFRTWDLTDCAHPAAYFGNSVSDMYFSDCHFDGRGLSDTVQDKACLFSLYSDADAISNFTFTRCTLESPEAIVNSPLRVSLNSGTDVHVQLTDSTLYGFRWTTRITADENESTTGTIDPAANGFAAAADAQTAAAALTALGRFLSEDNVYLYHTLPSGQTEYCRRAETYGVTT